MADRSPTNWSMHGAIAGYLSAAIGAAGVAIVVWSALHHPSQAAPTSAPQPITFPGVHIMPLPTPWLFGALYVVGIVVGGYFQLKAARIRSGTESGQAGRKGVISADAVEDFSISDNPAGDWSYGWSRDGLGNRFERHTEPRTDFFGLAVEGLGSPKIASDLWVMHNQTGRVIRGPEDTYTVPPDMLHMHPGQGGFYDIVRWTCQKRGKYTIKGSFRRLNDKAPNEDCDVNVVLNNAESLFSCSPVVLRGIGIEAWFTFTGIPLKADDKIDFIVGVGPGESHGSDSTGLKAKIILQ
jgi:hypothetical protein